jgi:gliding motility-associated-like protein
MFGQNNTFYRKYNLPGMQGALQLEVTDDGGFIATGQHEGSGSNGDCDVYAYKLDVCGNIDWFRIYGTAGQDGGKSIIELNDGTFLVSGLYQAVGNGRAFNMRLDANGNILWIKRYAFEWMMYAQEAQNGDFISLGRNAGQIYLMRTDSNGNVIWTKLVTGLGDMGLFLEELPNQDIVITSVQASYGRDFAAAKFDGQGNMLWSKAYGGTGWSDADHTSWSCKAAINTLENTMVVTTPTYMGGIADENVLVSKISLVDGSVIWAKAYGGAGRDQSRDITHFPGGYAIVGHTNSYPTPANPAQSIYEALGEKDIMLFAIDENGNLLWTRTYGGASRDKGAGVKYNQDNGFSISAFTSSDYFGNADASFDPLFIKTDSVGVVGCQMASPNLGVAPIALQVYTAGVSQGVAIANDSPPINMVQFTPNDQYVCQSCSSVPLFSLSDTTVCINEPVYLTNTTIVGLTCFQEWNIDGIPYAGDIDPMISFPAAGDYSIYLYSTCGINSDTVVKTIHVLAPVINAPDFLCENAAPAQMSSNIPNGTWSGQNVNQTGVFNPQGSAQDSYSVYYSVPEYCQVSDSIQIRDLPVLSVDPDTAFCFSANYVVTATNNANYLYTWSPAQNLSQANISNPTFSATNNSTSNQNFPYSVTVTDQVSTCVSVDNIILTVFPAPNVNAGQDVIVCDGDLYPLSASGAISYVWSNNSPNNSSVLLPIGVNELGVIGTDANDCVNADTVLVNIVSNPIVFAGNDTLICLGEGYPLGASSQQANVFVWNGNLVNGNEFSPNQIGDFSLTVTGTDVNSCIGRDTLNLEVHPLPVVDFDYSVDCYSTNVSLTNNSSINNQYNETLLFSWFLNNTLISTDPNGLTYDFGSSGNASIELVVQSVPGACFDSLTQVIEVPTNPSADISFLQNCDYIVDLTGTFPSSENILSSSWLVNNVTVGQNNPNFQYQFPTYGEFTVTYSVTNDYPCIYTTTQVIDLIEQETLAEQIVPNVITPNNDGVNDEIDFNSFLDECIDFDVYILNRWGNVVYKSKRDDLSFKGNDVDGQQLKEGVYFYKLMWNDEVRHGNITIIR